MKLLPSIALLLGATLFATGSYCAQTLPSPPIDFQIDGTSVQPSRSPEQPRDSNTPSPDQNSTIIWDTRSGGRQALQNATSISDVLRIYTGVRNSNGASQFLETNVDGNGTKARGCQWAAPNGREQECYVATEGRVTPAPVTGWYTQFKLRLGKGPGLSGVGKTDHWTLTGSNPHQKTFIWTRSNPSHRIYMVIRPFETKFSIDGLNWSSPIWALNPYNMIGENLTITTYFRPIDGTVKAWINDALVLNATSQNIGDSSLTDIQESVTTFPGDQQAQYMWDTVVWY